MLSKTVPVFLADHSIFSSSFFYDYFGIFTDHKAETECFLGLFLIPAGLAMVPVMAWMMCIRQRKLEALESTREPQLPMSDNKFAGLGVTQTYTSATSTCPPVSVTMTLS